MARTPLTERPRLRSGGGAGRLPRPPAGYDAKDQAEFRRIVEQKLQAIDGNVGAPLGGVVNAQDHGVTMDGTTDDTEALQALLDEVFADGGGTVFLGKGTLTISANVTCDRLVSVWGAGTQQTKITASTEKAFQIVGADSKWSHTIRDVHFDNVRVEYGPTNTDYGGKGAILQDCEVSNCTKGVVYTHNCFLTCIDRCRIYNDTYATGTYGVYFDFDTAGSGSGASMKVTNSDIFNCEYGLYLNGNTSDGHDIVVLATDIEHCGTALKAAYVDSSMEGTIHLIGCHLELNTVCQIDNNGSHVFLDHFWALTGGEDYSFIADDGTIHISNGRLTWGDYFAKMLGGVIYYDQATVQAAGTLFGEGSQVLTNTATATGGRVLVPRTIYSGGFDASVTLTNAAPGPTTKATLQAYDGNRYAWSFNFACTTAGATDNILKMWMNPGGGTVATFALPLADGHGRCWVSYTPGGSLDVHVHYVTAAGAASTYYVTSADTNGETAQRTFDFKSDKIGATASQIAIRNLQQDIHGYIQTGI